MEVKDFYVGAAEEYGEFDLLPPMGDNDMAYLLPVKNSEIYWMNMRGESVEFSFDSLLSASHKQNPALAATFLELYSGENRRCVSELVGTCIGNVSGYPEPHPLLHAHSSLSWLRAVRYSGLHRRRKRSTSPPTTLSACRQAPLCTRSGLRSPILPSKSSHRNRASNCSTLLSATGSFPRSRISSV